MSKNVYIVYNPSIDWKDEDDAGVYCTAQTLEEAKQDLRSFPDGVIWEYDFDNEGCAVNGHEVYRRSHEPHRQF